MSLSFPILFAQCYSNGKLANIESCDLTLGKKVEDNSFLESVKEVLKQEPRIKVVCGGRGALMKSPLSK